MVSWITHAVIQNLWVTASPGVAMQLASQSGVWLDWFLVTQKEREREYGLHNLVRQALISCSYVE